jgi:AraC-like DNA-binding protein
MSIPVHLIERPDYRLESFCIEKGLDYMHRARLFYETTHTTNIFPEFWMLYIFDRPDVVLRFARHGKMIELKGSHCIYIPRFSPVETIYAPGWYTWRAYSCFYDPDPLFPKEPVAFVYEPGTKLFSYDDIANYLRRDHKFIPIGKEEKRHQVAVRTQAFLHAHFTESLSIVDMSKELKIPHTTMTPYFHANYGISPVAYRNLLRVFESLRLISMGIPVQDAATKAGFMDYTRFYRNFCEHLFCAPSQFARRGLTISGQSDPITFLRRQVQG